jgi:hypothetical protein
MITSNMNEPQVSLTDCAICPLALLALLKAARPVNNHVALRSLGRHRKEKQTFLDNPGRDYCSLGICTGARNKASPSIPSPWYITQRKSELNLYECAPNFAPSADSGKHIFIIVTSMSPSLGP